MRAGLVGFILVKGCRSALLYTLIWTRLGYFCSLGYINSIETSTDYRQSDIKKVIPRSSCCTSFFLYLETYTTNLYSLYFELKKTKKMEIWLICCNSRLCIVRVIIKVKLRFIKKILITGSYIFYGTCF